MKNWSYEALVQGLCQNKNIQSLINFRENLQATTISLVRTISRYREYSDDSGRAIMTDKPSSLATALLKISGKIKKILVKDLQDVQKLNAFYIIPTLSGGFLANILSTHPPVEKVVLKLKNMLNGT